VTPDEQLAAVTSGALEMGCILRGTDVAAGALELDCPDVAAKVELLNLLARVSAHDPYVAGCALALRGVYPDDAELAAGVPRWVAHAIRWIDEPGERFQLAGVTLRSLTGDCDCSAVVVAALFLALGLGAEVRGYVDEQGNGIHACAAVLLNGTWWHAEATSKSARFGDNPAELLSKGIVK